MAGSTLRTLFSARTLLAALALLAGVAAPAHAVSVSPTALYIDSLTRTGVLTLYNPGTLPEEITVDFAYGYPQSDSAGNVTVTSRSSSAVAPISCSSKPGIRRFEPSSSM